MYNFEKEVRMDKTLAHYGEDQRPYEKPHLNGASPPQFHKQQMLVTTKNDQVIKHKKGTKENNTDRYGFSFIPLF